MAGFKEQMAADAAVFFNQDEFADAAVYNDGTADHAISIIIDETGGSGTGRNATQAQVEVPISEVPAPQYQQTITVGGVVWTIDQAKGRSGYPNDGVAWILPVIRDQKVGTYGRS